MLRKIDNHNQSCTAYVWMHAVDLDPTYFNDTRCDIYSNMITIAPGAAPVWATLNAFALSGTAGFSSFTTAPPPGYFTTTTGFTWTDATYQWQCQSPCLGNGGDNISEQHSAILTFFTCYGAGGIGGSSGSCITGGTWTNQTGSGTGMDNILIDLN